MDCALRVVGSRSLDPSREVQVALAG
jgi:hypothetical protein